MRTLICEGVRSFIVVESWLFLLGLEVFSMWDSTSNSSGRGEQGFPFLDLRAFLGNER